MTRLAGLLGKVWQRLVNPSTIRLLSPLVGVLALIVLVWAWRRLERRALGRALRWWCAAAACALVLAVLLYLLAAPPDDPEAAALAQLTSGDRLGRVVLPGPLALAGGLITAVAALAAGWSWRMARVGSQERAQLAAEWAVMRRSWLRGGLLAMALVVAAMGVVLAAGSTGAAQVPPAAASAQRGTLWVGTRSGISRLAIARTGYPLGVVPGAGAETYWESFVPPRAPLPSARVMAVANGADGVVWIGTSSGLVRYTPGDSVAWKVFSNQNSSLPHWQVLQLAPDGRGGVWAATERGAALVQPDGDGAGFTEENAPLLHQLLDATLADREGRVWFGGAGGVNVYRPDSADARDGRWPVGFSQESTDDALPDDLVFTIYEDHLGRIWFGTLRGAAALTLDPASSVLGVYERARWQTFTQRGGAQPLGKVHAITEDARGRIWFGTEQGVVVLDESLPAEGRWQTLAVGGAHGLPHPWAQALLRDPDGRVWVGTRGGLAVCDPAQLETGCLSYRANLVRYWAGYLWPPQWRRNIISNDITALAWAP